MKFGYLAAFSKEEAQQAAGIGFDGLEAHARSWPIQEATSKTKVKALVDETQAILAETGLCITAIANYDTAILTKPAGQAVKEFRKVIEFASALGVGVISAMAGRIPDKPVEESVKQFEKVYGEIAKIASDARVKIAFENWPGLGGYPIVGRNIAYCPAFWDMMFEAVPSKALGIEYDPSHLYWLGIDYIATVKAYADRIYHVHAKDTEMLPDLMNRYGCMEQRGFRYRIPGLGEIDWPDFISTLYECGFNGGVAIEHEDPVFSGDNRVEGFRIGYNFLKPLLPR